MTAAWCFRLFLITALFVVPIGCNRENASERSALADLDIGHFFDAQAIEISEEEFSLKDIEYRLVDGTRENWAGNRGKVILLNFWATWCYPCLKEMPDMEDLHHLMKEDNFRILAVNYGEKEERVRKFLKKSPYSFDIVLDNQNDIGPVFRVTGLPTTFIIDPKGRVLGKVMGPKNWKDRSFVDFFKRISRE
ncbi:MAG: TlpA family protein disulfide reductase [Proteobacteria bacterium]|nr:TlpA family protein disulfide reductase [Pseudomonadota bacterium]